MKQYTMKKKLRAIFFQNSQYIVDGVFYSSQPLGIRAAARGGAADCGGVTAGGGAAHVGAAAARGGAAQYRYVKLQYRFAVTSGSPSILIK